MTNDIQALDQLVTDGVVTLFSSTLTLIGVVVILLLLDAQLALVTFLTLPGAGGREHRLPLLRYRRLPARAREDRQRHRLPSGDALGRARDPRLRPGADGTSKRFAELNDEHRDANMRTVYLNAAYFPGVELLSALATGVILLYGGYQVIDGNVTIGVLVAFVGYLQSFFDPIQQLSNLYATYQQGMAALEKIFGLLDTAPDMKDREGAQDLGADSRRHRARAGVVLLRRRRRGSGRR